MCRYLLILTYSILLSSLVFGQNTLTTATSFLMDSSLNNRYDLVSDAFKEQVSKQKLGDILGELKKFHGDLISFELKHYFSQGVTDYTYYCVKGEKSTAIYKFVINRYSGLINGFFLVDTIPLDDYSFR